MTQVPVQPFRATYRARAPPSTVAVAVRHSGTFWFRGRLSAVAATVGAEEDGLVLEGAARVDAISIGEPAAMRASVLGRRSSMPTGIPKSPFAGVKSPRPGPVRVSQWRRPLERSRLLTSAGRWADSSHLPTTEEAVSRAGGEKRCPRRSWSSAAALLSSAVLLGVAPGWMNLRSAMVEPRMRRGMVPPQIRACRPPCATDPERRLSRSW